jgi:hypothetical protein
MVKIMSKQKIRKQIFKFLECIAIIVTIILGGITIYDKIKVYVQDGKEQLDSIKKNISQNTEIHILIGETKRIFEDSLLIITLDKILKEDSEYLIYGTLNGGHDTMSFVKKGQGESIEFPNYIIQIMKIRDDYAEFSIVESE